MTINALHKKLGKMIAKGHGNKTVCIRNRVLDPFTLPVTSAILSADAERRVHNGVVRLRHALVIRAKGLE